MGTLLHAHAIQEQGTRFLCGKILMRGATLLHVFSEIHTAAVFQV